MSSDFWLGLLALPALAASILAVLGLYAWLWEAIDKVLTRQTPRRIANSPHWNMTERRSYFYISTHAPLLAAIAASSRKWFLQPAPGWIFILARDSGFPRNAQLRQDIRDALGNLKAPVDEADDR